jgi:hypothetical protein
MCSILGIRDGTSGGSGNPFNLNRVHSKLEGDLVPRVEASSNDGILRGNVGLEGEDHVGNRHLETVYDPIQNASQERRKRKTEPSAKGRVFLTRLTQRLRFFQKLGRL